MTQIIGTRGSKLAQWQARFVQSLLKSEGAPTELKLIQSHGDIDQTSALTAIGGTGVFTKTLDLALLDGSIDIAVHSYKDYPTMVPEGIVVSAILEREDPRDVLIFHPKWNGPADESRIKKLATGSVRRRTQWMYRYPDTEIIGVRGNVPTRIKKLFDSDWDGMILAAAGLNRLSLHDLSLSALDWMIPAPAQGAICVTCRADDQETIKLLRSITHNETDNLTAIERSFMSGVEAGCSVPLGAHATMLDDQQIHFTACVNSTDGLRELRIDEKIEQSQLDDRMLAWIHQTKSEELINDHRHV